MLTILTVPKPFRGRIGEIQRNAIESWLALEKDVQVVLLGDEDGVEAAAREAGVLHVGGLARNDRGTPRLDSAFERAGSVARWPLWCFVNADIVLLDDFPFAVRRATAAFRTFLIIGECRDLDVPRALLSDRAARSRLHEWALEHGRLRGWAALDYFVFPRGLYDPVPPFLIGRACYDNWLVWRAREQGVPVVDATRSVVAVHQSHDYAHIPGGFQEAYYGAEARYNEELAGGRQRIYSLHDATHRLYPKGAPVPYWGSAFRVRERMRDAKARADFRAAERKARARLPRPIRVVGVLPRPRIETTPLLDALADSEDVELVVLYAANAPVGTAAADPPRHSHWYARRLRIPPLDWALGREYPINWAIAKSFHRLRPDCMIVAGWSAFATQAAIGWCIARRVPYVLVVDEDDRPRHAAPDGNRRRVLAEAVVRNAAAVLVAGPATMAFGPGAERNAGVTTSVDELVARVRALAPKRRSSASSTLRRRFMRAYRAVAPLRHVLTRRVRRRRTRSVYSRPTP